MIIATLDTAHFNFIAMGVDVESARDALARGWDVHRTQSDKPVVDLRFFEDDIRYIDISAGDCVRDYGCKL